jgi:hypothetical protein
VAQLAFVFLFSNIILRIPSPNCQLARARVCSTEQQERKTTFRYSAPTRGVAGRGRPLRAVGAGCDRFFLNIMLSACEQKKQVLLAWVADRGCKSAAAGHCFSLVCFHIPALCLSSTVPLETLATQKHERCLIKCGQSTGNCQGKCKH